MKTIYRTTKANYNMIMDDLRAVLPDTVNPNVDCRIIQHHNPADSVSVVIDEARGTGQIFEIKRGRPKYLGHHGYVFVNVKTGAILDQSMTFNTYTAIGQKAFGASATIDPPTPKPVTREEIKAAEKDLKDFFTANFQVNANADDEACFNFLVVALWHLWLNLKELYRKQNPIEVGALVYWYDDRGVMRKGDYQGPCNPNYAVGCAQTVDNYTGYACTVPIEDLRIWDIRS